MADITTINGSATKRDSRPVINANFAALNTAIQNLETSSEKKFYTTVGFANADFICDGVNDQVEIQAAIDSISASGGIVRLKAGTYSISAQILIDAHNVALIGAGIKATKIVTTAATFDAVRIGTRQTSGIMRNNVRIQDLTVSHFGGASTKACVFIDGGGRGTGLTNVQTNEGGYGFRFKDLDRCLFVGLDANNPRTAGMLCETGLENTWGTVTWINCSFSLSDNNSIGALFDTASEQSSPNRFDRLGFYGCLFYSTSGLTGTSGLKFNVGATACVVQNSLFESNIHQVHLDGNTQITFIADSFIQNNATPSTNIFRLTTNNHTLTIQDCRLQKATNAFNGESGFSVIQLIGNSTNQGNITNLFAGSFSSRIGTDCDFAGDNVLNLGRDSKRLSQVQSNLFNLVDGISAPSVSAGRAKIYIDAADGDLKIIFGDGVIKTIVVDS